MTKPNMKRLPKRGAKLFTERHERQRCSTQPDAWLSTSAQEENR
mgnify:CR=1 FL=1